MKWQEWHLPDPAPSEVRPRHTAVGATVVDTVSAPEKAEAARNEVAESIFSNPKSERIKRRIYSTRAEAKSEIFDYIEGSYNRARRHKRLDQLSTYEFERQRQTAL